MRTKIKLVKLLNEILNEIGDLQNIKPYEDLEYSSPRSAYFYTDSRDLVDIEIENNISYEDLQVSLIEMPKIFTQTYNKTKGSKDIININFMVNYDDKKGAISNIKEYYRILKTVLLFSNEYIKKTQPFAVIILASEVESSKNIKGQLYLNIIKNNIDSNYRLVDNIEMKAGYSGFLLMRTK
jgi:hypothetical protein